MQDDIQRVEASKYLSGSLDIRSTEKQGTAERLIKMRSTYMKKVIS